MSDTYPDQTDTSKSDNFLQKIEETKVSESDSKFSILSRLTFTLRILIFSVVITGIIGTTTLIYLNSIQSEVINKIEPLTGINQQLDAIFLNAIYDARNYVLDDQSTFKIQYQQSVALYDSTYRRALTLQNQLVENHNYLGNENLAAQHSFTVLNELIKESKTSNDTIAYFTAVVTQINGARQIYESNFQIANSALENQQKSYQSKTRLISIFAIGINLIIFLLALILGLTRSRILNSSIQGLLSRLTNTLKAHERGDLSARAESSLSKEELDLANAINSMASARQSLELLLQQEYEKEKRARENLEEERALREALAATLYKDLDATTAFQNAIEGFGKALRADRAIVRIIENGKAGSTIFQWYSPTSTNVDSDDYALENIDQLRRLLYQESDQLSQALTRGSYICVDDVANDPRLSEYSRKLAATTGLGAFISVPVVGESGPEAIMVASIEGKTRNWSQRDIETGTTLAAGLGATLAAIRLYDIERQNLESMKRLDKTKDEFIASVSHELRTPLTSIIGYLELLKDEVEEGNISTKYEKMLDAIDRNSIRLLDLIENVLTASKIQSGKLELSTTTFQVSQLISGSVDTITPQSNAKQIQIRVQISPDVEGITADITLLDRAMLNLLSNAIKFTPPGGTVSVIAKAESGYLEISVTDTGMGIPKDEIDNMFTKFFRTTQAKEGAIQGTGLGLSITKSIIEAHSGTIEVESTLGEGTTFTLKIPLGNN